ncbi:MAG: hypothetical protein IKD31_05960 [Clostridia bacterium]|nr:hypothetical protein [Clostridia bacterium]
MQTKKASEKEKKGAPSFLCAKVPKAAPLFRHESPRFSRIRHPFSHPWPSFSLQICANPQKHKKVTFFGDFLLQFLPFFGKIIREEQRAEKGKPRKEGARDQDERNKRKGLHYRFGK